MKNILLILLLLAIFTLSGADRQPISEISTARLRAFFESLIDQMRDDDKVKEAARAGVLTISAFARESVPIVDLVHHIPPEYAPFVRLGYLDCAELSPHAATNIICSLIMFTGLRRITIANAHEKIDWLLAAIPPNLHTIELEGIAEDYDTQARVIHTATKNCGRRLRILHIPVTNV